MPYHGSSCDIWSCGVILFALLTGHLPFDDENIRQLLRKVKTGKYVMPDNISKSAQDLIRRILVVDPSKRLTMKQIMAHPWFKETEPMNIHNLPVPSMDIGQPISHPSEIDDRILETIKFLWGDTDDQVVINALLQKEHNMQKVVYVLLQQHAEKYWQAEHDDETDDEEMPPPFSRQYKTLEHRAERDRRCLSMAANKPVAPWVPEEPILRRKSAADTGTEKMKKSETFYSRFVKKALHPRRSSKDVQKVEPTPAVTAKFMGTLRRKSIFNNSNDKKSKMDQNPSNEMEPRKSATISAKRLSLRMPKAGTINSKKFGFTLGSSNTKARKQLDLSMFNEPLPPPPALSDGSTLSCSSSSTSNSSLNSKNKSAIRRSSQASMDKRSQHRPTTPSLLSNSSNITTSPIEPTKPSWLQHLFFFKQPKVCSFIVYSTQTAHILRTLHKLMNRHASFYQKLKNERDKTFSEKDKAKQLYDDACAEIESLKSKLNKSSGDHEKIQRQLDAAYLECDNKKNLYLLAITAANAERSKYFEQDLPALADQLEMLDAERVECLRSILCQYIQIEQSSISTIKQCYEDISSSIENLDPIIESGIFIRKALDTDSTERAANVTFSFMPWNGGANAAETIIDRDDHLVTNDTAAIFLNNKLIKDRKHLDTLGEELSKKSTELSQLESAVSSIQNKGTAEYDKANEKLLDLMRDITMLSTDKVKVKSEIDLIIQHIGDDGLRAKNHDFKQSSFTIPTTCDYCNSTIWGLSNKGLTCKACGFNCHAKCEMKVAPNCSKVKGQVNPQPVSVSRSQSKSTFRNSLSPANSTILSNYPDTPLSMAPPSHNEPSYTEPSYTEPSYTESSYTESSYTEPSQIPTTATTMTTAADIRCIYSYDAQNEDELSIQEGDELSTIEPDDGSGWIKAQRGHQVGLIPASYVEPLHKAETVTALYDFEAVNPEELQLREGDVIIVTKKDVSGWWEGSLNGKVGIFPANYVQ
ncbi:Putative CAMK/CAMKL/BRSK protein kinase [Rhizopus microsporus]|nr:Putative CAMK/CAMKL/BRSK protein kinase [Rhizopus microsporus]